MRIAVEAHPNASIERVDLSNATLCVWVRARAVEGQANLAIEKAIAKALGLRRRQVHVVGGTNSRRKIVEIEVRGFEALQARLREYGFTSD